MFSFCNYVWYVPVVEITIGRRGHFKILHTPEASRVGGAQKSGLLGNLKANARISVWKTKQGRL